MAFIILTLIFIFVFFLWRYTYWKRLGIAGPIPIIPIGNTWRAISGKEPMLITMNSFYKKYKKHGVYGTFIFHKPALVICDIDLVQRVLGPDLEYWNSHGIDVDLVNEPLNAHLFLASGEYWKNLRKKLEPAFTPGRIKAYFQFMEEGSVKLIDYLNKELEKSSEIDTKTVLFRYTTEVIGMSAFGFKCESFEQEMSPFFKIAKRIVENTPSEVAKTTLKFMMPGLTTFLGIKQTKIDVEMFFEKVTKEAILYRETNNIKRNDFLDILIGLKNNTFFDEKGVRIDLGPNGCLSELEIVAQVYMFFFAGYETSAATGSLALRMLAQHPDVQERAREEVKEVLKKHDGKFSFEALSEMDLLSNIVDETMRLFPAFPSLFRKCTKDYIIPGTKAKIPKGTVLFLPIFAIQRDAEYFENPNDFDPDRFSPNRRPNNLNKIYMSYGRGPRVCIGIRFGILQTKLALAKILTNFEVSLPDHVEKDVTKFDYQSFITFPVDGVNLIYKRISL